MRVSPTAPADQRWEAFAALTNITNEAIVASGVFGPANGSQIVSYRAPRMFYAGMRFEPSSAAAARPIRP